MLSELIHVCQAEKTTIRLYRNHPELRTVWKDVEARKKVVTPEKAEQPAGLKVTLLPFQRESLFWMRKQEGGIWKGGLLAVCLFSIGIASKSLKCRVRMRWGVYTN